MKRRGGEWYPHQKNYLPYVFTLAFSTIFVQALMIGFETAGMRGVFIAAAIAYIPLGFVAGIFWSPRLLIASALAGIPTLLFIFALHQWSIITALGTTVEGVPIILEPVSVSVFFFIGGWLGNKAFVLRKRFSNTSASA